MRILIAPDKFKGSISAREAAEAIQRGLGDSGECQLLPIADGGEGTAETVCHVLGGSMVSCEVSDPLGRPVSAEYGLAGETAILEMSQASGLWRLSPDELDPWTTSTFGTGEMILDARRRGATKIILGIGGSATNDGGFGMARALGIRFLNQKSSEVDDVLEVARVEPVELGFEMTTACDVTNPLLGADGATRIYGAQKGVSASEVARHEARLAHLADVVERDLGGNWRDAPGAGAAGGLGFGCLAFCGATLRPGFDLVSDLLQLEAAVAAADVVITGEGSLDAQTLQGKGPHGVALLAQKHGKPAVAFAGHTDGSPRLEEEFGEVLVIRPDGVSVEESMRRGAELLEAAVRQVCETGGIVRIPAGTEPQ